MQWTQLLSNKMEESYATADSLMGLLTDDELDWKPATGKNWMTVGQVLMHLTNSCGFCCNGFATGEWGIPEGSAPSSDSPENGGTETDMLPPAEALPSVATVAEARALLGQDKDLAFAVIKEAGEEKLESEMSAAPWDPANSQNLGSHCLGMVQHLDSHRHQLFYYLKLMDKDVNTMTLWNM